MKEADSAAAEPRRVVTQIVLTYKVEGDQEQKERTLTLSRDGAGVTVDGVIWSRALMDRLAYLEGHGPDRPRPVPRRPARPNDGWKSRGRAGGSEAAAGGTDASVGADGEISTAASSRGGDEECLWLHDQSCTWISLCDNPWPL